MQRYFVPPEQMSEQDVRITGEDVKHIAKVMRLKSGDKIICLNNQGRQTLCEITSMETNVVTAVVLKELHEQAELPVSITIAQSLVKGDKLEFVIQKGTELGASSFYLYSGERSVVKWESSKVKKKLERLRKIAKEAAEQAERLFVPDVLYYHSTEMMLEKSFSFDAAVYLYEEQARHGQHHDLADVLHPMPSSILAVIGPEGGISEKEAVAWKSSGCRAVSLGPRILRSETAPLYLLSALSYHYEILR
ncbi:16S rRNA (uracil(1498)-N(3))-methyltransferase [Salibacterium aidingense]|uniref:16S rRNA (uracil(1498)-N(3))-methyltransferase n=1 Tax=Salibacterium aidingense TaxID=384933 RepID=UPI003BDF2492